MQGVILAAGKGSRLHPITLNRSKAMLPILGRPVVEHVMEDIAANGVEDFIVVVSPNDRDIITYFREESPLKCMIRFVYQPKRLGMADALSCAVPLIEEDFIVSACDNLTSAEHVAELMACYKEEGINGAMSLMEIPWEEIGRTGIVELEDGWVKRVIEKPSREEAPTNIATLPLYIFNPVMLDYLPEVKLSPRGEYELQDAIQMLIDRKGGVRGVFTKRRLTLTGPEDLLAINRHYLINGHGRPQMAPYAVGPNTHLITPLRIEGGTVIGENCTIGPNVYIERDCNIGSGVKIKDAVVLRGSTIEDEMTIEDQVVW